MSGELGVGDEADMFLFVKGVREEFEETVNGALTRFVIACEDYIGGPAPVVAEVLARALRDGADRLEATYPRT
jgi:hypothetical protein